MYNKSVDVLPPAIFSTKRSAHPQDKLHFVSCLKLDTFFGTLAKAKEFGDFLDWAGNDLMVSWREINEDLKGLDRVSVTRAYLLDNYDFVDRAGVPIKSNYDLILK